MHLPVSETPEILLGDLWAHVRASARRIRYYSLSLRKGACPHVGTHLLWKGCVSELSP